MVPFGETILDHLGIDGECMVCTGDSGIAQKVFILLAFYGDTGMLSAADH